MKKTITAILLSVLCVALATPALAADYSFSTGGDTLAGFGKATSTDSPVPPDPMGQNERRDKDTASMPPPCLRWFYFAGYSR